MKKSFKLLFLLSLLLIKSCAVTIQNEAIKPQNLAQNHANSDIPKQTNFAAKPANLNFRVLEAYADISGRSYVLDPHNRAQIVQVNDKTYQLELTLKRNSNSSLRGDEKIITHFYYDGLELIFFGDRNKNQIFDRSENAKRYLITHTFEIVQKDGKTYGQGRLLKVDLERKHLSSGQKIKNLTLQLLFLP